MHSLVVGTCLGELVVHINLRRVLELSVLGRRIRIGVGVGGVVGNSTEGTDGQGVKQG